MLYKNLQTHRLFKVFMARLFLDIIASLKFQVDGGFKDFFAVYKAHFNFWKNFRTLRKKREKIKHRRVSHIFWGNIVFEYYLRKIKRFAELDQHKFTGD